MTYNHNGESCLIGKASRTSSLVLRRRDFRPQLTSLSSSPERDARVCKGATRYTLTWVVFCLEMRVLVLLSWRDCLFRVNVSIDIDDRAGCTPRSVTTTS